LCHGDLGNLICSDTALFHSTDNDQIVSSNADAWANALVQGSTTGWRSSSPSSVETPGLMMGLAGIAWALAYSVSRETEPNLLLLEGASRLSTVGSSLDVNAVRE
jgi:lantibiotic modifying enzyme